MYNFCTLFDSNYLTRGLAMYESLSKYCPSFHLYIFPFDDKCCETLKKLNLPHATIIPLQTFENPELLTIKPTRTKTEYCWTCTPSVILYVLQNFKVSHCTYVDADLYFYANPSVLIEEMEQDAVLITEHRYTPRYDKTKLSGRYCVQFITFKNEERGMKVLQWWQNACINWCYNKLEDGKFGDQKYLDDWTKIFDGIHVLKNLGGGVALWNVQQYDISLKEEKYVCKELKTGIDFDLIFYHFHYLRFYNNGSIDLGRYTLPSKIKQLIYLPHLQHLEKIKQQLYQIDNSFDPNGPVSPRRDWFSPFRYLLRKLQRTYNIHNKKKLLNE